MKSKVVAADRVAVFVVGALLAGGGASALLWSLGELGNGRPVHLAAPLSDVDSSWWPWACGGAGAVLVAVGLWWLSRHRRTPRARDVRLADQTPAQGSLSADPGSVASVAADILARNPAVLKASARASVEDRVPTITVTAVIAARHALSPAVRASDEVAATVAQMLGDGVAVRTRVRVDARERKALVA